MKQKKHGEELLGRLKKSSLVSALLIGSVISIVLLANMNISERHWQTFGRAEGNPGAGASGFLYFCAYPHTGDGETDYATNLSYQSASYEYSDTVDAEMTGETPYSTAFDFVCKYRVNASDGYNTSSSSWMIDWSRVYITVDFQWASDVSNTTMSIVEIVNNTNFAWYHAYINNSNNGYQISKGETYNVTELCGQVYR